MRSREPSSRRYFFWLCAKDPENGKPYLIFGGNTEDEARRRGIEMLSGIDFVIKRFPTRDLSTASAFLRGVRLDKGEGLHKSSERQGHDKTLRRRLQRRDRR